VMFLPLCHLLAKSLKIKIRRRRIRSRVDLYCAGLHPDMLILRQPEQMRRRSRKLIDCPSGLHSRPPPLNLYAPINSPPISIRILLVDRLEQHLDGVSILLNRQFARRRGRTSRARFEPDRIPLGRFAVAIRKSLERAAVDAKGVFM